MHLHGSWHRKERGYFDPTVAVNGLGDNGGEHEGDRHAEQDGNAAKEDTTVAF